MIKLHRKTLVRNLELLKKTATLKYLTVQVGEGMVNAVFNGQFHLMANSKESSFVCIEVDAEYESDPFSVMLDLKMIPLLKVSTDEFVTLNFNKNVTIRGESGYRASLALAPDETHYYSVLQKKLQFESERVAILDTDSLMSLCKLSKDMPAGKGNRWVEISFEGDQAFGRIQETELGSLEALPLSGEMTETMNGLKVIYLPYLLEDQLRYSDKRVKLVVRDGEKPSVVITDPDNPVWWGCLAQYEVY